MVFGSKKNAVITPAPSILTRLAQAGEDKYNSAALRLETAASLRASAAEHEKQATVDDKHAAALAEAHAILEHAGVEV